MTPAPSKDKTKKEEPVFLSAQGKRIAADSRKLPSWAIWGVSAWHWYTPFMSGTGHRSDQYYKKALPMSVWRRVLATQQQALYERFAELYPPRAGVGVINIGVNANLEQRHQYFLESRYPFLESVVGCGLETGEHYERLFPAATYRQVSRDAPLPFEDGEFDLAFCSAVVEHVGNHQAQRSFVEDTLRVAKRAFFTTPNRWYPVELHTLIPLLHYLPTPIYRHMYRKLGFEFFSQEENLNLLDRKSLERLVPTGRSCRIHTHKFLGLPSNLLLEVY